MRQTLIALMLTIAPLAPQDAAAGERMINLFRQGYQLVATEPYMSFEGCDFDKPIKVGAYIFMCRTYEYIYHYGKVELLGRTFTAKDQSSICARAKNIASPVICRLANE